MNRFRQFLIRILAGKTIEQDHGKEPLSPPAYDTELMFPEKEKWWKL